MGLLALYAAYLRHDHATTGGGATVAGAAQSGDIILWDQTTIPSGWVKCDGLNGTPDLRGRFIIGADDVTVTVGATGGTDTSADTHSHAPGTLATDAQGSHLHNMNLADDWGGSLADAANGGNQNFAGGHHTHQNATSTDGNLAHSYAGTTDSATPSAENRPQFKHYYYIMYL